MQEIKWGLMAVLAVFGGSGLVRAGEAIAFPKDNPAFTFEVPKEWSGKFNSAKSFRVDTNFGEFYLTEISVHDKEGAKKYLEKMIDLPCSTKGASGGKKQAPFENKLNDKIDGIWVCCSGEVSAGLEKGTIQRCQVAFSPDGKRYFELFGLSMSDDVQAFADSIKLVSAASTPAPSPQK